MEDNDVTLTLETMLIVELEMLPVGLVAELTLDVPFVGTLGNPLMSLELIVTGSGNGCWLLVKFLKKQFSLSSVSGK